MRSRTPTPRGSCCAHKVGLGGASHAAKTWVNGLSSAYEANYDLHFFSGGSLGRGQFIDAIEFFNEEVGSMFPCPLCFCYGYCCCLCTLGLSFVLPYVCMNDAKERARETLNKLNRDIFHKHGLRIELEYGCSTSWLAVYKELKGL